MQLNFLLILIKKTSLNFKTKGDIVLTDIFQYPSISEKIYSN